MAEDGDAATAAFALPDPAFEAVTWDHQEHMPGCQPPLAQDTGFMRAFQRPGAHGLPGMIHVNGYMYTRHMDGSGSFGSAPTAETERALAGWRDAWLPRIEQCVRELESFDPEMVPPGGWWGTIERQQAAFGSLFGGLHMATMGPVLGATETFLRGYVAIYGEERRLDALAMLQGFPNGSSERAEALWRLSRELRANPALHRALERDPRDPGTSPAARAFRAALDELLARYGHTTQSKVEDLPTWREDPALAVRVVLRYAEQDDDRDPRGEERRRAQRRETLQRELEQRATTDPWAAALLPALRAARYLIPVSEDHNLLGDQRVIAASRARWLHIGGLLARRGLAARADDVFYFRLDELIDALEQGRPPTAEAVARRRAEQAHWRTLTPPSHLGRPLEERGAGAPAAPLTLRGTPASQGVHRGRARVLASIEQAPTLERGDVLICSATSPEWTPYFRVIGALVTDSGGPLTHGAIVAREFGLPAIVAARHATRTIPDGATVTVDGGAGVVTIEP